MAKLMVMIDIPELSCDELRESMLKKEPCRMLVDFAFQDKSKDGYALVSVDAAVMRRLKYGTEPAGGLFELIGVRP